MKDKNHDGFRKKCLLFGIVALAILVTINLWGIFYLMPCKSENSNNFFPYLNPARSIYRQEDLIINFQPLRDYLNNKYEKDPNVSIYFEYLNTGANISISKDAEFYPASLLKVPVAMAVAKKIERGDWKWTNELVLMSADKDEKFGDLYKQPTGSVFAIEELVRRSLRDSDNTAHFILVRNLEMEEIEDVYDHMGLKNYLSGSGEISAKKYSIIFRALYNVSYLSEKNSQKIISYLSESKFHNYLESALPANTPFAHKIGTADSKQVYLDSGIVYMKNRPYLLTVMIKAKKEEDAIVKMKDISEMVYKYVSTYKEG